MNLNQWRKSKSFIFLKDTQGYEDYFLIDCYSNRNKFWVSIICLWNKHSLNFHIRVVFDFPLIWNKIILTCL